MVAELQSPPYLSAMARINLQSAAHNTSSPPYQPPRHYQDPLVHHPSYNQPWSQQAINIQPGNRDPSCNQPWRQHPSQNLPWIQPFQQDWVRNSPSPPSSNPVHQNYTNHNQFQLDASYFHQNPQVQPNPPSLPSFHLNPQSILQFNQSNWNIPKPAPDSANQHSNHSFQQFHAPNSSVMNNHTSMSNTYIQPENNQPYQDPYNNQNQSILHSSTSNPVQLNNYQHVSSLQIQPNLPNSTSANLEIPQFDGTYVDEWVIKVESYFKRAGISAHLMVQFASLYLHGDALNWYESMQRIRSSLRLLEWCWPDFVRSVVEKFSPNDDSYGNQLTDSHEEDESSAEVELYDKVDEGTSPRDDVSTALNLATSLVCGEFQKFSLPESEEADKKLNSEEYLSIDSSGNESIEEPKGVRNSTDSSSLIDEPCGLENKGNVATKGEVQNACSDPLSAGRDTIIEPSEFRIGSSNSNHGIGIHRGLKQDKRECAVKDKLGSTARPASPGTLSAIASNATGKLEHNPTDAEASYEHQEEDNIGVSIGTQEPLTLDSNAYIQTRATDAQTRKAKKLRKDHKAKYKEQCSRSIEHDRFKKFVLVASPAQKHVRKHTDQEMEEKSSMVGINTFGVGGTQLLPFNQGEIRTIEAATVDHSTTKLHTAWVSPAHLTKENNIQTSLAVVTVVVVAGTHLQELLKDYKEKFKEENHSSDNRSIEQAQEMTEYKEKFHSNTNKPSKLDDSFTSSTHHLHYKVKVHSGGTREVRLLPQVQKCPRMSGRNCTRVEQCLAANQWTRKLKKEKLKKEFKEKYKEKLSTCTEFQKLFMGTSKFLLFYSLGTNNFNQGALSHDISSVGREAWHQIGEEELETGEEEVNGVLEMLTSPGERKREATRPGPRTNALRVVGLGLGRATD